MNKLPIPENIPLRKEYWRGFGVAEARRSVAVTAVVLAITWGCCMALSVDEPIMVLALSGIVTAFLCVGFFGRLDQSQSIYEFLVRLRRFRTQQQTFRYQQAKEVIQLASTKEA